MTLVLALVQGMSVPNVAILRLDISPLGWMYATQNTIVECGCWRCRMCSASRSASHKQNDRVETSTATFRSSSALSVEMRVSSVELHVQPDPPTSFVSPSFPNRLVDVVLFGAFVCTRRNERMIPHTTACSMHERRRLPAFSHK